MKAKEQSFSNVDQYRGYSLTNIDIPVKELRNDISKYQRISKIYNEKSMRVSNFIGTKENKYNHSIPLNKIGLLSENLKRMKKNENIIN